MSRILGVLLIVGGLFCGGFALLEAGVEHGWKSMMYHGRLWQGTALLALIAGAILVLVGLITVVKKPKR